MEHSISYLEKLNPTLNIANKENFKSGQSSPPPPICWFLLNLLCRSELIFFLLLFAKIVAKSKQINRERASRKSPEPGKWQALQNSCWAIYSSTGSLG